LNEAATLSEKDILDNLIRSTVRGEVAGLEPAPEVRDTLMAAAVHSHALRSAVGPAAPALIEALCENADDDNRPRLDPEIVIAVWRRQWLLLTVPAGAVC
jgi:hypothetical protein